MKIITIMDYDTSIGSNYITMTKIWLNLVHRYGPGFDIELLYVNETDNVLFGDDYQRFIKNFNNVSVKKLDPIGLAYKRGNANHKATYDFKHAVWNEEAPYIFIDTDLFIFSDINNFYSEVGDAPFVGTGHGSYRRGQEKALNGGFFYMGKTNYVDPIEAGEIFKAQRPEESPLDQNVLFNYLKHINYDPFIIPEAERWNWFGKEATPRKINGGYKAYDNKDKEVYGAHFFGNFKPWRCNHWLEFWEESVKEVGEMSK